MLSMMKILEAKKYRSYIYSNNAEDRKLYLLVY